MAALLMRVQLSNRDLAAARAMQHCRETPELQ
jgi:hypothetical protein